MMLTKLAVCALAATLLAAAAGCEKKPATPPAPGGAGASGGKHDGHDHGAGGHVIALESATIGQWTVKATRDEGKIVAGGEAPIDVTLTPAAGAGKVAAVRFWIGAADAKGSVKAKAEIEDPKHPGTWHTHAEVPSPLPAGSRLWVEIEDDKGAVHTGSFDLKM
ncbi:MAG TPA: hypothetical protein VEB22_10465 [Phycisphaerales bacterium]|nr:hypothetical protein [Phycisphaerales bacterium]